MNTTYLIVDKKISLVSGLYEFESKLSIPDKSVRALLEKDKFSSTYVRPKVFEFYLG